MIPRENETVSWVGVNPEVVKQDGLDRRDRGIKATEQFLLTQIATEERGQNRPEVIAAYQREILRRRGELGDVDPSWSGATAETVKQEDRDSAADKVRRFYDEQIATEKMNLDRPEVIGRLARERRQRLSELE